MYMKAWNLDKCFRIIRKLRIRRTCNLNWKKITMCIISKIWNKFYRFGVVVYLKVLFECTLPTKSILRQEQVKIIIEEWDWGGDMEDAQGSYIHGE